MINECVCRVPESESMVWLWGGGACGRSVALAMEKGGKNESNLAAGKKIIDLPPFSGLPATFVVSSHSVRSRSMVDT